MFSEGREIPNHIRATIRAVRGEFDARMEPNPQLKRPSMNLNIRGEQGPLILPLIDAVLVKTSGESLVFDGVQESARLHGAYEMQRWLVRFEPVQPDEWDKFLGERAQTKVPR